MTFDKPMNPKKHGLHLYENNQTTRYFEAAIFLFGRWNDFHPPLRLKPATLYRLELNSTKDIGFARVTRVPLGQQ